MTFAFLTLDPLLFLVLLATGILAGTSSGLFGIGGGVVTVPALLLLTSLDVRQTVGVSLLSILLTTPLGLFRHAKSGNVRWRLGWQLGLAGLLGVATAAMVDPHLTEAHLTGLFSLFLLFASQRVAYGKRALFRLVGWPAVLATGFGAGLLAKLLGIGGGLLVVPALVFAGLDVHVAVATSLVSVLVNAAGSTGVNLWLLEGPWPLYALPVTLGSLVGVVAGTRWGLATESGRLRQGFAILLAVLSLVLVVRSLG